MSNPARLFTLRRTTAALLAALCGGSSMVAAQSQDAEHRNVAEAALNPRAPVGGNPRQAGNSRSPIALGGLAATFENVDVALSTGIGGIGFERFYTSTPRALQLDGVGGIESFAPRRLLAPPFGRSYDRYSMQWSHRFHGAIEFLPRYVFNDYVRDAQVRVQDMRGGRYVIEESWGDVLPNTPQLWDAQHGRGDARVYWDGAGKFTVFQNGSRVVYEEKWSEPWGAGLTPWRVFLPTRIETSQYGSGSSSRTLADLSYGSPTAAECSASQHLPYFLREVTAQGGTRLKFTYKQLPSSVASGEYECVLAAVHLIDAGSPNGQLVAQYQYARNASGQEQAGLLESTLLPDASSATRGLVESYAYKDAAQNPIWSVERSASATPTDKLSIVKQQLRNYGIGPESYVQRDTSSTGDYTIAATNLSYGPPRCFPGMLGNACDQEQLQYFASPRSSGDGTGGNVTLTTEYHMVFSDYVKGTLLRDRKDMCSGGDCSRMTRSGGTASWGWSVLTDNADTAEPVATWAKDKRDNYVVQTSQLSTQLPTNWPLAKPVEVTRVQSGATTRFGDQYLGDARYAYAYGGKGRTPRVYEQLVTEQREASVLAPGGQEAVTYSRYDDSTNRLVASIREGYTQGWSGSAFVPMEKQFIGTFFFTREACSAGTTDDPMGRIVEVHGPCRVSGPDAKDCDIAEADTSPPVTRFTYHAAGKGPKSGQIATRQEFTAAVVAQRSGSTTKTAVCDSSASLTTQYHNYDGRGRLLWKTDPNGLDSVWEYDGERLMAEVVGGQETRYGYDYDEGSPGMAYAGQLAYIKHPNGIFEVYCYRNGDMNGGRCDGGKLTDRPTWKAVSAYADARTWTEKHVFDYDANSGQLSSVTHLSCPTGSTCSHLESHIRTESVERMDSDALGRPTYSGSGVANTSHGYSATSLFDGNNNKVEIGFSYSSAARAALEYDRRNQLTDVTAATSGGTSTRACLAHDSRKQLDTWMEGCSGSSSCASCNQPKTDYTYDDFGRVIAVAQPWTAGTMRFVHDGAGRLRIEQTPAMAAVGDVTAHRYDGKGRKLAVERLRNGSLAETLLSYLYDNAEVPPNTAGCPTATAARSAGRLRMHQDSLGRHFPMYDTAGRVTAILRARARTDGTYICGAVTPDKASTDEYPNSRYGYTADGRLAWEMRPHGRTVHYSYYPNGSGRSHLVQAIFANRWNGTQWVDNSPTAPGAQPLIYDIEWGAQERLITYKAATTQGGAQATQVAYLLGEGDDVATATCSALRAYPTNNATGLASKTGSIGALSVGNASGDVFKRLYQWRNGLLTREETCLWGDAASDAPQLQRFAANATTPAPFGYDNLGRLTQISTPATQQGGVIDFRSYTYDAFGQVSSIAGNDLYTFSTLSPPARPAQLASWGPSGLGSEGAQTALRLDYGYDEDGRVKTMRWPVDSSGQPSRTIAFDASADGTGVNAGGRYRTARVTTGASSELYRYYYDGAGRRRLKAYPDGKTDEFFYAGPSLVEDRGIGQSGEFVLDEYIYLDDKPVVYLKSGFNAGWQRKPDGTDYCQRDGVDEQPTCGVYFPVADYIGKPVLLLNDRRMVTGVGDYDAYGHVNRVRNGAAAPRQTGDHLVATLRQPVKAAIATQIKPRFYNVDTPIAGWPNTYFGEFRDSAGNKLEDEVGGPQFGPWIYSQWLDLPTDGRVDFWALNRLPNGNSLGSNYAGLSLEGYDLRRWQPGAQPTWLPLRLPGQYHDRETDLFENGARFYDPRLARYTSPDPALVDPLHVGAQMNNGQFVSIYGYANGNPLLHTDPSGMMTAAEFSKLLMEMSGAKADVASAQRELNDALMETQRLAGQEGKKAFQARAAVIEAEARLAQAKIAMTQASKALNAASAEFKAAGKTLATRGAQIASSAKLATKTGANAAVGLATMVSGVETPDQILLNALPNNTFVHVFARGLLGPLGGDIANKIAPIEDMNKWINRVTAPPANPSKSYSFSRDPHSL
jgi:RHS repeat-associated protein